MEVPYALAEIFRFWFGWRRFLERSDKQSEKDVGRAVSNSGGGSSYIDGLFVQNGDDDGRHYRDQNYHDDRRGDYHYFANGDGFSCYIHRR